IFEAPPVDGLGTAGGFKIVIEDRSDLGTKEIETVANNVVATGNADSRLKGIFTSFRANTPWLFLDIDREKAKLMGVSIAELFNTLQVYLGGLYVKDVNRCGRTWQVNVQGDADFRKQIDDLSGLRVRGERGGMVPLGTLAQIRDVSGPVMIIRYNLYPSATVNLNTAPGTSSGQALEIMENVVAKELPQSMVGLDRAGLAATPDRQHGDVRLHAGRGARLPGAGRPVRELVAAPGGHPGRADVPALLDDRRERGPDGYQHLYPGGLHRAGRPGVQERDPDRRVRQEAARVRRTAARGHARRLRTAVAADHHDLDGVHPGRGALDH